MWGVEKGLFPGERLRALKFHLYPMLTTSSAEKYPTLQFCLIDKTASSTLLPILRPTSLSLNFTDQIKEKENKMIPGRFALKQILKQNGAGSIPWHVST